MARISSSAYVGNSYYGLALARARRQAVADRLDSLNSLGGNIFAANSTLSQGLSQIAAQQYADRVQAQAKAKLAAANSLSSVNKTA